MADITPEVRDITSTSATLRFDQMNVPNNLAQYYRYDVQVLDNNGNNVISKQSVRHDETMTTVSINFTVLSSKTQYIARVVPYRNISHNDFKNQKSEEGNKSQLVMFTTRKLQVCHV